MNVVPTPLILNKALPQRLRALGLNEAWLQHQIFEDPSLLGIGDLDVIRRERIQPTGGRLDLLLADYDSEARYEVELMLGTVDESHIIRTIEYWDIERQRFPHLQHTAVIVAEEITSRFFNVIRLLNRAIPLMAIQLSAFRIENQIILQFIRVLDTAYFGTGGDDTDEPAPLPTDRAHWETKSKPLLSILDSLIQMLPSGCAPRIAYNKSHIAIATDGYNFAWLHPRKMVWNGAVIIKVGTDIREDIVTQLATDGVDASLIGKGGVRLNLTLSDLEAHRPLIADALKKGEEWSRQ